MAVSLFSNDKFPSLPNRSRNRIKHTAHFGKLSRRTNTGPKWVVVPPTRHPPERWPSLEIVAKDNLTPRYIFHNAEEKEFNSAADPEEISAAEAHRLVLFCHFYFLDFLFFRAFRLVPFSSSYLIRKATSLVFRARLGIVSGKVDVDFVRVAILRNVNQIPDQLEYAEEDNCD